MGLVGNGVAEVGPEPVVLSESEAKGNSPTEATSKPSSQDEPSRSSDTSETSSQSEDRLQRPSSEDTKKVCEVYLYSVAHILDITLFSSIHCGTIG